ncbi:phosphoglycerate dehydrogenase-like enzyme [Thermosporothrix hazakensis]|jgi:phosphoglycerate dehydrogenase-like enzyme|uniref:Phosphoglycerate dehydrogenase-like enzyme n=1 Tax=Thermosporothrix hazakensis TaxID=644383 RepID=A0A326U8E2_THEHA|nr:D-2-hydroxyacid dehydrogenase [Thermosporothrix hazakensis]PZW22582.1 phosphoglycerate dehydrogenase-like enzyme [Thermosporothrix hazakensis]GCE48554.1 hydroxyacid dehydrogenase [Thermosporothrix hazakensis]
MTIISTFPFATASVQRFQQIVGEPVLCVTDPDAFLAQLHDAEILCSYWVPDNWRQLAPKLRWLQATGAGIDNLQHTGILAPDSGVLVTTAVGIHAASIGEYVFGSMLMFNRSWPEMVRLQDRHIWPRSASWYRLQGRELAGQTLGVIGLGHIGRRVAQLGRAFGMNVVGTRRSAQPGDKDPDVDLLYPASDLLAMLAHCDYIVIAVPLTSATERMIGEAELRAMKRNAYLVNVARGQVIDEPKLIQALQEGWIAGAGLDVVAEEPLSAESPLFSLPNVIITPHIAGENIHYEKRLADLFAENLARYTAGQPLQNVYDPNRGY